MIEIMSDKLTYVAIIISLLSLWISLNSRRDRRYGRDPRPSGDEFAGAILADFTGEYESAGFERCTQATHGIAKFRISRVSRCRKNH